MRESSRNHTRWIAGDRADNTHGLLAPLLVLLLLIIPACYRTPQARTVQMSSLAHARPTSPARTQRIIVADPAYLRAICQPLGPRLGLVEIHTPAEWALLRQTSPGLGPCPNLDAGICIGLASWAGKPVDDDWPLTIDSVRIDNGGGLVQATFQGGSYLPDGSAYLETMHVSGLRSVLAVEINGTTFYPH